RLAGSGQIDAAYRTVQALLDAHPLFARGWFAASEIALQAGETQAALEYSERGLTLAPDDARMRLQRASCLMHLGRRSEALEVADALYSVVHESPEVLDALGSFYSYCGEQSRALECYQRVLAVAPGRATTRFNRATVRRFLGDLAGAEADYDAVIEARPHDYEAVFNRSELRRQTSERNHVLQLEAMLAGGVPRWHDEVRLRYALAKELEDLGRYAQSWQQLAKGAGLRRAHLQYDVERDVQTVDWIANAFPSTHVAPIPQIRPPPIFIVGLPRSGSTLIERILSCHTEVSAAGELDDFARALTCCVRERSSRWPLSRQELIEASTQLDFAALGLAYLRRARPRGSSTAYFTDKMPLNYLYCGLIARALPGVRIIHVIREPMAVCYAMYKTLFNQGYPFSYDLQEIGRYYLGYRRLMRHWEETLPGSIYRVSYESLVEDQAGETRRLLEFCGLGWQDACLAFEHNPAATMTASATQVREGLHRRSLQLWRHYERELQPLIAQLAAAGVTLRS
ncbi:MAG: sulfotransferase, partial [Sinobacteraceae bacterium]|nr:sulfotransferase [Nevskiaceae bacterium]